MRRRERPTGWRPGWDGGAASRRLGSVRGGGAVRSGVASNRGWEIGEEFAFGLPWRRGMQRMLLPFLRVPRPRSPCALVGLVWGGGVPLAVERRRRSVGRACFFPSA